MGADTKAIKNRIRSVTSTLHLARAMGLVASSKIRKAADRMNKAKTYAASLDEVMDLLSKSPDCQRSIYMKKTDKNRMRLIVIAGDRGLAGGYNANVFRLLKTLPNPQIVSIGKRACEKSGQPFKSSEHFSSQDASQLANTLVKDFENEEFDRLGILYTRYVSMMVQEADIMWVLPFEKHNTERKETGVVFEPNEAEVMKCLIPQYVAGKIMHALRESFACEVAARRTAMDSAEKNAQQMIDDLQLQYNRERQNAITQEITEIVSGSGS